MVGRCYSLSQSNLGIPEDLQVAVHTYDGCSRGCPGCVVDKHFKNRARFRPIMEPDALRLVHDRVVRYHSWVKGHLRAIGSGHMIDGFSYSLRFGNHSELGTDQIIEMLSILDSKHWVVASAPTEDIGCFVDVRKSVDGILAVEIIYDPLVDKASDIAEILQLLWSNGIVGYPEILVTTKLVQAMSPKDFVEKCMMPFNGLGTNMQFGRYMPSRTRGFRDTQMVAFDIEAEWMAQVAAGIVSSSIDVHIVPLEEWAVTMGKESSSSSFDFATLRGRFMDMSMTRLYVDHNLDVYPWAESLGEHILDANVGFDPIGNLNDADLSEMMENSSVLEGMCREIMRHAVSDPKCSRCEHKVFCLPHGVPLFRRWERDDGEHCYGYLAAVNELRKGLDFHG